MVGAKPNNTVVTAAWPLHDPAKFTGSPVERAVLLNELYGAIRRRLDIFCSLPFASLDRMDWVVFTSAHAVDACCDRLQSRRAVHVGFDIDVDCVRFGRRLIDRNTRRGIAARR